tara:strand:- start:377 stop:745 length:369 start_codon:yes stop_codon:yes gene_type:complete
MSTIKANDLTNTTGGIPTVKSQYLIPTAWVNFNGTGTVAIRDSENVSSITDSATGLYLINFATAMANTNYAVTATSQRTVTWLDGGVDANTFSTSNFRLENVENSTGADTPIFGVQVMGGQA